MQNYIIIATTVLIHTLVYKCILFPRNCDTFSLLMTHGNGDTELGSDFGKFIRNCIVKRDTYIPLDCLECHIYVPICKDLQCCLNDYSSMLNNQSHLLNMYIYVYIYIYIYIYSLHDNMHTVLLPLSIHRSKVMVVIPKQKKDMLGLLDFYDI